MKTIPIYQVDAFTNELFKGNPAAICPIKEWLPGELMQNIAAENNLSETAFVVKEHQQYHIRWFTPTTEVNLCGHATVAAAFVLKEFYQAEEEELIFNSKSGILKVQSTANLLTLDFPTDVIYPTELKEALLRAIEVPVIDVFSGSSDIFLLLEHEDQVRDLKPNMDILKDFPCRGVGVTAPGKQVDFVSRFFAPQSGINEDPVTGSAHTTLIPYWAEKLNKTALTALQVSERGGFLKCNHEGDRVKIGGEATLYMKGEIFI